MSSFASLLDNFKQTTQHPPPPTSQTQRTPPTTSPTNLTYPTTPVRRIYIACPPSETGGPEALHQLCHVINTGCKGQVSAFMLYLRERRQLLEPIWDWTPPEKYGQYQAPSADSLPGEEGGGEDGYSSELVVWPEIWTRFIDCLQPNPTSTTRDGMTINRHQVAIWWLSVDNNRKSFQPGDFRERLDVIHLVQSAYARQYVLSNLATEKRRLKDGDDGISLKDRRRVLDLTEFIPYSSAAFSSPLILDENTAANDTTTSNDAADKQSTTSAAQPAQFHPTRTLDVLYNPAKGMHYTNDIIRRACGKKARFANGGGDSTRSSRGSIQFDPIGKGEGGLERISGEEVLKLLRSAKVYIDFGHHPGMDRLPREATLAGCIVLTNREGAANFDEDVPLHSDFKFQSFDVDRIYSTLNDCCCDPKKYEEYVQKMEPYRQWIMGQEERMRGCVDSLIAEILTNRALEK